MRITDISIKTTFYLKNNYITATTIKSEIKAKVIWNRALNEYANHRRAARALVKCLQDALFISEKNIDLIGAELETDVKKDIYCWLIRKKRRNNEQ